VYLLECIAPKWVVSIFHFLDMELITQKVVNEAINWLYSKSIIVCNEII